MKKRMPKAALPKLEIHPGINVAMPNTIELKMQAILAVSRAVENLSKALISMNIEVMVANNVIHHGSGPAIQIALEEVKRPEVRRE